MNTQPPSSPSKKIYPVSDRLSLLWLLAGFVMLIFSNGEHIVPIAAWLGPVFIVRFLRTQKVAIGLLVGYFASAIAFYFEWNAAFRDAGAIFTL
jgi:hypothetical protein